MGIEWAFFGAAAEAMRRILVDRARSKLAQKRGGGQWVRVEFQDDIADDLSASDERLVRLDAALERLEATEPVKAQLVKLRYFAGLTGSQAAQALGIGVSTADKYWAYAKAWLKSEMS